jgi:hypothetical protein
VRTLALVVFSLYLLQIKTTMTREEFAKMLDGRVYDSVLSGDDQLDANEYNLVIVYGCSDDLVEFEGAIIDELGAWGGGTFYYDNELESFMDIEDSFEVLDLKNALTIEAKWMKNEVNGKIVPWTFETNIPHSTFNLNYGHSEGGGVFCVGLVIELKALTK